MNSGSNGVLSSGERIPPPPIAGRMQDPPMQQQQQQQQHKFTGYTCTPVGQPLHSTSSRMYYSSIRLQDDDAAVVSVNDAIELLAGGTSQPFVAVVEALWHDIQLREWKVRTRWFYRAEDISPEVLRQSFPFGTPHPREVFLSDTDDDNDVRSIIAKVKVVVALEPPTDGILEEGGYLMRCFYSPVDYTIRLLPEIMDQQRQQREAAAEAGRQRNALTPSSSSSSSSATQAHYPPDASLPQQPLQLNQPQHLQTSSSPAPSPSSSTSSSSHHQHHHHHSGGGGGNGSGTGSPGERSVLSARRGAHSLSLSSSSVVGSSTSTSSSAVGSSGRMTSSSPPSPTASANGSGSGSRALPPHSSAYGQPLAMGGRTHSGIGYPPMYGEPGGSSGMSSSSSYAYPRAGSPYTAEGGSLHAPYGGGGNPPNALSNLLHPHPPNGDPGMDRDPRDPRDTRDRDGGDGADPAGFKRQRSSLEGQQASGAGAAGRPGTSWSRIPLQVASSQDSSSSGTGSPVLLPYHQQQHQHSPHHQTPQLQGQYSGGGGGSMPPHHSSQHTHPSYPGAPYMPTSSQSMPLYPPYGGGTPTSTSAHPSSSHTHAHLGPAPHPGTSIMRSASSGSASSMGGSQPKGKGSESGAGGMKMVPASGRKMNASDSGLQWCSYVYPGMLSVGKNGDGDGFLAGARNRFRAPRDTFISSLRRWYKDWGVRPDVVLREWRAQPDEKSPSSEYWQDYKKVRIDWRERACIRRDHFVLILQHYMRVDGVYKDTYENSVTNIFTRIKPFVPSKRRRGGGGGTSSDMPTLNQRSTPQPPNPPHMAGVGPGGGAATAFKIGGKEKGGDTSRCKHWWEEEVLNAGTVHSIAIVHPTSDTHQWSTHNGIEHRIMELEFEDGNDLRPPKDNLMEFALKWRPDNHYRYIFNFRPAMNVPKAVIGMYEKQEDLLSGRYCWRLLPARTEDVAAQNMSTWLYFSPTYGSYVVEQRRDDGQEGQVMSVLACELQETTAAAQAETLSRGTCNKIIVKGCTTLYPPAQIIAHYNQDVVGVSSIVWQGCFRDDPAKVAFSLFVRLMFARESPDAEEIGEEQARAFDGERVEICRMFMVMKAAEGEYVCKEHYLAFMSWFRLGLPDVNLVMMVHRLYRMLRDEEVPIASFPVSCSRAAIAQHKAALVDACKGQAGYFCVRIGRKPGRFIVDYTWPALSDARSSSNGPTVNADGDEEDDGAAGGKESSKSSSAGGSRRSSRSRRAEGEKDDDEDDADSEAGDAAAAAGGGGGGGGASKVADEYDDELNDGGMVVKSFCLTLKLISRSELLLEGDKSTLAETSHDSRRDSLKRAGESSDSSSPSSEQPASSTSSSAAIDATTATSSSSSPSTTSSTDSNVVVVSGMLALERLFPSHFVTKFSTMESIPPECLRPWTPKKVD